MSGAARSRRRTATSASTAASRSAWHWACRTTVSAGLGEQGCWLRVARSPRQGAQNGVPPLCPAHRRHCQVSAADLADLADLDPEPWSQHKPCPRPAFPRLPSTPVGPRLGSHHSTPRLTLSSPGGKWELAPAPVLLETPLRNLKPVSDGLAQREKSL